MAAIISPRRISAPSATSSNPMGISIINSPIQISYKRVIKSFDKIIAFIIPTLLAFLSLMFLGTGENPFATHPKTMRAAVATSLVFYLISSQQISIRLLHFSSAVVNKHCKTWFGNATVVSLASIFAPDSLRPLLYAIFVLLSGRELLHWLCKKALEEAAELHDGTRYINARRFFSRMAPDSWFRRPTPILPTHLNQ